MNVQGNTYTFVYASILVVVVASLLAFIAVKLQPIQARNIQNEKMQNILASAGIESSRDKAKELFDKHITKSMAINSKGEIVEGQVAFDIDLKKQLDKDEANRVLPVFLCENQGNTYAILQVRGKGLWGPIWGYLALEKDYNTIFGAIFDHKGETPGLGADINKDWFEHPFKGKKLFDEEGKFVSITVYKGGKGAAKAIGDLDHGVDGISGGTITCKALETMLNADCLVNYVEFLKKSKGK